MRSSKAFTLIELLVVIAIIAILAAILFPVFAQAKAAAKSTACLSGTKQVNLAIIQYTNDNDDTYTGGWYGGLWTTQDSTVFPGGRYTWLDAVQPYVKNTALFNCPTSAIPGGDPRGSGPYVPRERVRQTLNVDETRHWGSYGLNCAYWDNRDQIFPPTSDGGGPNVRLSTTTSVDDVAGTILVADANGAFQFAWPNNIYPQNGDGQPSRLVAGDAGAGHLSWGDNRTFNREEGAMVFRHPGNRSNVGFTDGHSKSVTGGAALKRNEVQGTPTFNALSMFTAAQD